MMLAIRKGELVKTLYRIRYDSRHFAFEVFGDTPNAAREIFARGLLAHAEQTGASPAWVEEVLKHIGADIVEVGAFYRDGERLECGQ